MKKISCVRCYYLQITVLPIAVYFRYSIACKGYFFKVHSIEMSQNPPMLILESQLHSNNHIQALVDEK